MDDVDLYPYIIPTSSANPDVARCDRSQLINVATVLMNGLVDRVVTGDTDPAPLTASLVYAGVKVTLSLD